MHNAVRLEGKAGYCEAKKEKPFACLKECKADLDMEYKR